MALQLEDGSVAAPTLRWNSQANTGFYLKSSGTHTGYPAVVFNSHYAGSDFEVLSIETAAVWASQPVVANTMHSSNIGSLGYCAVGIGGLGASTGLIVQSVLGLGNIELTACSNGFRVAKFVNRGAGDVSQALFGISSTLTQPCISFMNATSTGITHNSGDASGTLRFITNGVQHVIMQDGSPKTMTVTGNHTITGTKSAVVETASYGTRLLYAVEAPTIRFCDTGTSTLVNGEKRIDLEPIFAETIEGPIDVYLTPYGNAHLYVSERGATYFVVKCSAGDDIDFGWMVYGNRVGYSGVRLEPFSIPE